MDRKDRIRAEDAIGKALNMADLIMDRDGIQALRGLAWTDSDGEKITAGLRAYEALHENERN